MVKWLEEEQQMKLTRLFVRHEDVPSVRDFPWPLIRTYALCNQAAYMPRLKTLPLETLTQEEFIKARHGDTRLSCITTCETEARGLRRRATWATE